LKIEFSNPDDLESMCDAHNDLIKDIIDKEEDLIGKHRAHIDSVVEIIK
jgi:hypothetical protein